MPDISKGSYQSVPPTWLFDEKGGVHILYNKQCLHLQVIETHQVIKAHQILPGVRQAYLMNTLEPNLCAEEEM